MHRTLVMQAIDIAGSSGAQGVQTAVKMACATLEEFAELLKSVVTWGAPSKGEEKSTPMVEGHSDGTEVQEEESDQKPRAKDHEGDELLVNVMLPQTELLPVVALSSVGEQQSAGKQPAVGRDEVGGKQVAEASEEAVGKMVFEILQANGHTSAEETADVPQTSPLKSEFEVNSGAAMEFGFSGELKKEYGATAEGEKKEVAEVPAVVEQAAKVFHVIAAKDETSPGAAEYETRVMGGADNGASGGESRVGHPSPRVAQEFVEQGKEVPASVTQSKTAPEGTPTAQHEAAKVIGEIAFTAVEKKLSKKGAGGGAEGFSPGVPTDAGLRARGESTRAERIAAEVIETADPNLASARPPLFVERLTERIAGGELRFGFRSAESGDMQVSTSLHNRVVEIGITAEKPEAASALRAELPALESHLRDHALRLGEAQISTGTTLSGQSQMGEQRRHPQEWKANVLPVYRDEAVVENESVRLARTYGTGMRISLMA